VQRTQALIQNYPESTLANDPLNISLDSIEEAFHANDPLAQYVVLEAGRQLGKSIAGLIGALNIHKIVLTGDMVRFEKAWLDAVEQSMRETALTRMAQDTQLEIGKMEFRGCILGASSSMLLDGYALLFTQSDSN